MVNLLYYFLGILLLTSSLFSIISNNTIVTILFLILSFFISTIMLVALECEFLALLFLIIYVGAVAVLFMFVLMMLESKLTHLNKKLFVHFFFGVFINVIFFLELVSCIVNDITKNQYYIDFLYTSYISWYSKINILTDIQVFGNVIYSSYILEFLIIGLILLLSLIGSIYLTVNPVINQKTKSSTNYRRQILFIQNSRNM